MKFVTLYRVNRERTSLDCNGHTVVDMTKLADLELADLKKQTLANAVMALCGDDALAGYKFERNSYTYDFVKHIGDEIYGKTEAYEFIN